MPETAVFSTAAVAAPHDAASQTGLTVLAAGGNAIEAMVAMAATIAVVYPHMNGLGGDGFWLVRERNGRVHALDASGPAGSLASLKRYQDKGYVSLPPRGVDSALTVAGAVAGWRLALELSRTLGGNLPLDLLLGDAIRHAREGYAVSGSEARFKTSEETALHQAPGFAEAFLMDGKRAAAGTLRKAPALAETLSHLVHAGLGDFYRGDVGYEIAADLERIGAPITRRDIETYAAKVMKPLSLRVGDATIHNLPPPTPGIASLMILGLFERLGVRRIETPEHHHGLVEAVKRAFAVTESIVIDPAQLWSDPTEILSAARLDREAAVIDMRRAASVPPPSLEGDTVWMGAIDKDGLAVSYIQSVYWAYGSGCILPKTGIHWHNRGTGFSLDPASPRALHPGRKPPHTLNPALAVFGDGRVMSYGTMGGESQPQIQGQIFTRYAYGMGVADAVDAPRWRFGHKPGERAILQVESRFEPNLLRALSSLGHEIEEIPDAYSDALGHAGMLVKHARNGRVEAAHDPRSDGGAMGL